MVQVVFFGMNPSSKTYNTSVEDSDNVVGSLMTICDELEAENVLDSIGKRQLRTVKEKINQIHGLLADGQINPQSYEKLSEITKLLQNQDYQTVLETLRAANRDSILRATSRPWLPNIKTLTNLARKKT